MNERAGWLSRPLDGVFEIVYRDEGGRYSVRELHAYELKLGLGKALLGGRVGGSGAYRGFRVDRIVRLTDLDTGEAVEANLIDWLIARQSYQAKQARRSDERIAA